MSAVPPLDPRRKSAPGSLASKPDPADASSRLEEVRADKAATVSSLAGVARALSGRADGSLLLWDVKTGRQIKVFQGHQSPVLAVAISLDDFHAISASGWDAKVAEERLRLWRIQTGEQIVAFAGAPPIRAVAVTPDNRYVLSGGRDGSLRLWNMTGRELHNYSGHAGEVLGLALARDCRIAVSVGTDHTIRVWRLPQ